MVNTLETRPQAAYIKEIMLARLIAGEDGAALIMIILLLLLMLLILILVPLLLLHLLTHLQQ